VPSIPSNPLPPSLLTQSSRPKWSEFIKIIT
jgi:hypothetical protein